MTPAEVAIMVLGFLVTTLLGIQIHKQNLLEKQLSELSTKLSKYMLQVSEKYVRGEDCREDQAKCRQNIIEAISGKLEKLTEQRSDAWVAQKTVNENLWDRVNRHGHTGLPEGSKVVI